MITIDLRTAEPRSAQHEIGGVKILARLVDKGRAAINGTLGRYLFFDCPLDRVFFDAVDVSRDEFLGVLRRASASHATYNADALADLRETLSGEPEVSDEYFLAHAEASDADNAAVDWLVDERRIPKSVLADINAAVDRLPPAAFIDWVEG